MKALFLLTGLLIGCSGGDEAGQENGETPKISRKAKEVKGEVIATVNGMKIGSEKFAILASRTTPKDGKALSLEERKEVLDKLVVEELLFQKALEQGFDQD